VMCFDKNRGIMKESEHPFTSGFGTDDVLHIFDGEKSGNGISLKLPQAVCVKDGDYQVTIPTASVSLDGDIAAEIINKEDVNGKTLVHLKVGDRVLFSLSDSKLEDSGEDTKQAASSQNNGVARIAIDIKQLTFSQNDKVVLEPLPAENSLGGKISKHKVVVQKEIKGKMRKVSDLDFTLDIAGGVFDCPHPLAMRLVNGGGQKVFDKELEFRFSVYRAKICEPNVAGIAAKVENILDYGKEKFAVCKVGENSVNIAVDDALAATLSSGKAISISLDATDLAIIEVARGIRLA